MTPKRKRLLIPILALAAACGGGGGGGAPGPATLAAYCDAYWSAYAARWAACERGSAAAAAADFDPAPRCADPLRAAAAGRASYDAGRSGACLAFLAGASCDVLEAFGRGAYPQADCEAAIAGHLAEGQTCSSPESCASGACWSWPNACPSTCVTPTAAGAACEYGVPCAAGAVCDLLLATPTCVPLSQAGGKCLNDAWCAPGLFCGQVSTFVYTCQARKTSGSCAGDSECAIGHVCTAAGCVARLGPGERCTQGENACGPGLWCGGGGACVDGPGLGGPCGAVAGEHRPCIGGWCDASAGTTCAPWGLPGATCSVQDQCAPTDVCDQLGTGTCTTLCAEP